MPGRGRFEPERRPARQSSNIPRSYVIHSRLSRQLTPRIGSCRSHVQIPRRIAFWGSLSGARPVAETVLALVVDCQDSGLARPRPTDYYPAMLYEPVSGESIRCSV
jgi:hypothetical protein